MKYYFTVSIPFEELSRVTLTASSVTSLPDNATLSPTFRISKKVGASYLATCEGIVANNPIEAKSIAVYKVETFLKILAARNDSFHVILSGVDAVTKEPYEKSTAVEVTETDSGKAIFLADQIFVTSQVHIVKSKANLDSEASVLANQNQWSEALKTALDFNYLAVIANKPATSFFLLASALQALAFGTLGPQPTLLPSKLGKKRLGIFKRAFNRFLNQKQWKFEEDHKNRIRNQALLTHKDPMATRLLSYLESIDITKYDLKEIKEWWSIRGKVAHPTTPINENDLREPLNRLLRATQEAIWWEVTKKLDNPT